MINSSFNFLNNLYIAVAEKIFPRPYIVEGFKEKPCGPGNAEFRALEKLNARQVHLALPNLDLLNEKISTCKYTDKAGAYKLERARILLQSGSKADALRALNDLNDIPDSLIEDALHLKRSAYSILEDWESFLVVESKLAGLKNSSDNPSIPHSHKIFNRLLNISPYCKKEWENFPIEWQNVILDNFFEINDSIISESKKLEYLKNAIDRFNILYNELSLTTEYEIEKSWMTIFQKVGVEKANALVKVIIEYSIARTDENRPEFLKKLLSHVVNHLPESIDQSIELFKQLKVIHAHKPELEGHLLHLFFEKQEILNSFAKYAQTNGDPIGPLEAQIYTQKNITSIDVLLKIAKTTHLLVKRSPEFLQIFTSYFRGDNYQLKQLLTICRMTSLLGPELTGHFLKTHGSVIDLPLDFLNDKDNRQQLIKVLKAEIKWKHKILPFLKSHSQSMKIIKELFTEDDPLFQYMNADKFNCFHFMSHLYGKLEKYKDPKNKQVVLNILKLAHEFSNIFKIFMDEEAVFDKSLPQTRTSKACHQLIEINNNPKIKSGHIVSVILNLLNSSDNNQVELGFKLMELKDEKFRSRLLSLYASGDIGLMNEILDLYEGKKQHYLAKILIAQTNSITAPIAKALMKVTFPVIVDRFKKLPEDHSFTSFDCALLALRAQHEIDLLKCAVKAENSSKKSFFEDSIVKWVEQGRFALANDLRENPDDPFWNDINQIEIPVETIQQLRNVRKSLKALPFSKENAQIIMNITMNLLLSFDEDARSIANEWIAMLQVIPLNNETLVKEMCNSNEWNEIQKIIYSTSKLDPAACLKTIKSFKVWVKLDAVRNATTYESLCEAIAKLLVTPSGGINRELIPFVISEFKARGDKRECHSQHLVFALETLRDEHYFSDRLEKLVSLPPKDSDQDKMLKSMYGSNYTLYDVRAAVINALLLPLRQGAVGSCFATAIAMNLNATKDGLKQSFEDYLSIVKTGVLWRTSPELGFHSYPIIFNEDFKAYFPKESNDYLVRVREYAMASMAGEAEAIFTELIANWNNAINPIIDNQIPSVIADQLRTEMGQSIHSFFSKSLKDFIEIHYFSYFKTQGDNGHGGWAVVDAITGKPLISSRSCFEDAFKNFFEKNTKLLKDGINVKFEPFLNTLCQTVCAYIRSDSFIIHMLGNEALAPNYFTYNPQDIKNGRLTQRKGGSEVAVIRTYFNNISPRTVKLTNDKNPWKSIFHYLKVMSPIERVEILRNPNQLLLMSAPGHGMNVRIGAILPLVAQAATAEEFIANLEKKNSELMAAAMTDKLQKDLLEAFYKQLESSKDFEDKKLKIEAALKLSPPQTLKEFCYTVTEALQGADAQTLTSLTQCIYNNSELQDKLPPLFNVVDTNWSVAPGMSFCIDKEGTNQGLVFTDPFGKTVVVNTAVFKPTNWQIHKFRPTVDDYNRTYPTF